ncbi:MAG: hypothetical protein QM719_11625 [Thermomonas sp.]
MRRFVLCLGLLLLWPLAGQAAQPASVDFGAGAWVDVDATGKAHVVEMDKLTGFNDDGKPGSIAEIIKARLRERIETWEFTPPTKNGVTVAGKTHVGVALVAEDDGAGGLQLRVKSARTGMEVLQFPSLRPLLSELGGASGWWFMVHLDIGPNGQVVDARMVDSRMFNGREFVAQSSRFARNVDQTITKLVKQMTFSTEFVDGQPIAGEGDMPIKVCADSPGRCDVVDPEPAAKSDGREFAAVNPAVQLRTTVAGTAL